MTEHITIVKFIMNARYIGGRYDYEIPADKEDAYTLGYEDGKRDVIRELYNSHILNVDWTDCKGEEYERQIKPLNRYHIYDAENKVWSVIDEVDEAVDICGLCGLPGADKMASPNHWPGERVPDSELVHAECEEAECGRAHAALSDKQRQDFLRTI